MANTYNFLFPIGRDFRITTVVDGQLAVLGIAGDGRVSVWQLQFNPDLSWDGSFVVLGRSYGHWAADKSAPFLPIAYRRVTVNNIASDRALVADPILTPSLIEIPANGLSVGLLLSCNAGFADVFSWDLNGPAT